MNARPSTIRQGIAQRRAESGLGVGCAEAQADGVPCEDLSRDCDHCAQAATAVRTAQAPESNPRARPPRGGPPDSPAEH